MKTKTQRPPGNLSNESKGIWKKLNSEWEFDTQALLILKTALEAYDRLTEARQQIDTEGITYTTGTGFKREHPSLKVEKQSRDGFLAAWRMLNLNIEPPGDIGRPVEFK